MSAEPKPRTGDINGRLWGARASDWSSIQEGTVRPVYETVLERTGVKPGTRYLDVGCGAGMAVQMAATRGAPRHTGPCQGEHPFLSAGRQLPDQGDVPLPAGTTVMVQSPGDEG